MKKYLKDWQLIINPVSGSNKNRDLNKLQLLLKDKGFTFEVSYTEYAKHASDLVASLIESGIRKFIIAGGDGTYNEVVNGIFMQHKVPSSEITLAMLPSGTGNDWLKTMELPSNLDKAIDVISKGKTFLQDIGRVSYQKEGQSLVSYFLNVAGTGFDVYVAQKYLKNTKGKLSYIIGALQGLLSYKSQKVKVKFNNREIQTPMMLLAAGICRFYGNGMKICPKAIPNDGLIDMTLVKGLNKWQSLKLLLKVFNGSFVKHPQVETFRSKSIKVESENPIYLQADGEIFGHSPFEFSVLHQGVRVVGNGTQIWEAA